MITLHDLIYMPPKYIFLILYISNLWCIHINDTMIASRITHIIRSLFLTTINTFVLIYLSYITPILFFLLVFSMYNILYRLLNPFTLSQVHIHCSFSFSKCPRQVPIIDSTFYAATFPTSFI